jgi:hypothetical protein
MASHCHSTARRWADEETKTRLGALASASQAHGKISLNASCRIIIGFVRRTSAHFFVTIDETGFDIRTLPLTRYAGSGSRLF